MLKYLQCESFAFRYYLNISFASGYIERSSAEEINENKCLILDAVHEKKSYLKNTMMFFNGIMDKIKEISNDDCDYEKDYMNINFNSDDDLPLNKPLKFLNMTITIKSVFKEDGKLYPQLFLYDTLYELNI